MRERTLQTVFDYPDIAKWIDIDKNISEGINLNSTYVSTCNKVWFKTPNGISFHRTLKSVIDGYKKFNHLPFETESLISGWNDLGTLRPDLSAVWDYERNNKNGIFLKNLTINNGNKAYFKCSNCDKQVETKRFISSVIRNGVVLCSKCSRSTKTSFQEQTIYYYILKLFPSALNGCRDLFTNNMELDIFIPELKLAIEYDGSVWHKDRTDKSIKKYELCYNKGITLIKATDLNNDIKDCDFKIITHSCPVNDDYQKIIDVVCDITGKKRTFSIDIDRDRFDIIKHFKKVIRNKSFGYKNTEAVKYWDYSNNNGIDPYDISANDTNKYWFIDEVYGSYSKNLNQITSGKSSYLHPKRSMAKMASQRQIKAVCYDVSNNDIFHGDYISIAHKIGINSKTVSRICNRKDINKHITCNKQFVLFKESEFETNISKVLKTLRSHT